MSSHERQKQEQFTTVEKAHWEKNWESSITPKPLSLLNIFNRDALSLLMKKCGTKPQPTVIEIGCVPGKYLYHLEQRLSATCHGFDYSETGCKAAVQFLRSQQSQVQIHCQDVLMHPPDPSLRAQLVYSIGVVEHFSDPSGMIRAHLSPLDAGGIALILLPNYSGLNRTIQARLDPDNLKIHNLATMTHDFWERHARNFPQYQFKTYQQGHLNPWMYSLQKLGRMGTILQYFLNFASYLIPPFINPWAGMFVIEINKR